METVLEIKISHDGRTMVAWDPNAEQEIASTDIRPTDTATDHADALKTLAYAVSLNWISEAYSG